MESPSPDRESDVTRTSEGDSPQGKVSKIQRLPSGADLDKAAEIPVFTSEGNQVPFKSLYWAEAGQRRRVMIIFIRHFFCGNCQEYLRSLTAQVPPDSLPDDVSIVVVGCGSHTLITSYIEETACPYPIFAEPTKKLHDTLSMRRSLSLGSKDPDYIQRNLIAGAMKSIVQGVKRIPTGDALSGGDMRLNGGEFLFEVEGGSDKTIAGIKGDGNKGLRDLAVTWCHRMTNTRDHAEIGELQKILAVDERESTSRRRRERRWTSDHLRRSFSNRRQSWLDRASSASRTRSNKNEKRDGSTSRSPENNIDTVREEMRSREGPPLSADNTT